MATYSPFKLLPYFAPSPVPLPSYEEIVAAPSTMMGTQNSSRHIVKVGEHFIVKYGTKINFAEGENMLIIRQYTNIPVPTLYAMYKHEPSGTNVIVMEYVPGEVLGDCYNSLSPEDRFSIGAQLRQHLRKLQNIPSAGFYGRAGARPYPAHDALFVKKVGPFNSANDFLEAYFRAQFLEVMNDPEFKSLKRAFVNSSKGHSAPVFTHGDLHHRNIILRRDKSLCIIDWELASYCPKYFELIMPGFYETVTAGLSENEEEPFLPYADLAGWIGGARDEFGYF
ncbi:kinase-like domain-containing protein [Xylaria sp. FL0064]|nr:kinase-like domain-containing protein [Xylaria sp. FL0064]